MKIIIRSQVYEPPPYFGSGTVGKIYRIKQGVAAKVYDPDKRETVRRLKILALCTYFHDHAAQLGAARYAFPEDPAYETAQSFNNLAGFTMRDFGDIPKIGSLGFSLQKGVFLSSMGFSIQPNRAISLVYELFELLDRLHKSHIILGDISSGNVLFSPVLNKPVFIDIDSAQVGPFFCSEVTKEFMAPELHTRGSNLAGFYNFDSGTDVFAMAAVSFEFLVGVDPNFIHTVPYSDLGDNRLSGISSIRYLVEGEVFLKDHNLAYKDTPENKLVQERLRWLKSEDSRLFDFFRSVFVDNERNNLIAGLPVNDPRHPGFHFHHFRCSSGFGTIVDTYNKSRVKNSPADKQFTVYDKIPDSGFHEILSKLGGRSNSVPHVSVPHVESSRIKLESADPAQFRTFLRQFNLKY